MAQDLTAPAREFEIIEKFLENVRGTVPLAIEQIETMLRLVAAASGSVRSYLDLGSAGGVFSAAILAEYPRAEAILLDVSAQRLAAARQQLGMHAARARFICTRFDDAGWSREAAPLYPYDLITSGVELPLLPEGSQRPFFAEAFELLRPGGFFLSVQYVASATRWTESRWDDLMIETIFGAHLRAGEKRPRTEIARAYYDKLEDRQRVAPLEVQCDWLRELGYESVECYLKIGELAVFGGQKPSGNHDPGE